MSAEVNPDDVLNFWIDEQGPQKWYIQDENLDEQIRQRFMAIWSEGHDGGLSDWLSDARGAFAYIILMDQFPRNMFRGKGRAFSTDKKAICAAKRAISKDWDLKVAEPGRQFFYLPLMHSECLADQDRCIRLFMDRMPGGGAENLLHARAHREVIRQFGRFPYRNEALERFSTEQEKRYIAEGGYGSTVKSLEEAV